MTIKIFQLVAVLSLLSLTNCGSSGSGGSSERPLLVAVDSTNDRLFIFENERRFLALTASTLSGLGDQPVVSKKRLEDIFDILPTAPTNIEVADVDGVSRIFITGARTDADLNQILVLDFDGTDLTVADISPITVDDGDAGTDNSADIIGGLLVDETSGILYVTDTTTATLSGFNTSDGSEAFTPSVLNGSPNKMSLSDGHIYIANASEEDATQNLFVFDTTDTSVTEIDLGTSTNDIAAATSDAGTVIVARDAAEARVLVRQIATGGFADSTAIVASDSSADDGEINSSNSIVAAVGPVSLAVGSDDNFYSYIPLADGDILIVTIQSDLSSFAVEDNETSLAIFTDSDLLTDTDGLGLTVFMTASGTGDLLFVDVGSTSFDAVL